ncbi:MAG: proline dehydrogenase family protein [Flavobacteriales bacterium]|nr:proline dehydrogenase family protein [Flavobacteriales bacterium]
MANLSFDNTEVAFKYKSLKDLKWSKWLFGLFNYPTLVKYGPALAGWALRAKLPVKAMVKNTIFKQFCGGETIEESGKTADVLSSFGVRSILDYSVEGIEDEANFDANVEEIIKTILAAKNEDKYPFAVFKCTGIGRFEILHKAYEKKLNSDEEAEFERFKNRVRLLGKTAAENGVKLLIDAEETWIQDVIDASAMELMKLYNKNEVFIYNTLQMYRVDRLSYLKKTAEVAKSDGYKLGYKLVRGAYMEKERERASKLNYPSPIQPDKATCDADFNAAVKFCFENRETISIILGTHNEDSSKLLAELMLKNNISMDDNRFWFGQLYGMSDHITFNLADNGFNACKYLPYGPVSAVMPYLGRRAEENSSMGKQVGREMSLIMKELNRRKSLA